FMIESQPIDDSAEPDSYLDPLLLQAPSLALNQAAREELRLMDEIKLMLRTVWTMLWGKNIRLISKVEMHQSRIERTQEELKQYISQVSDENLSEEEPHCFLEDESTETITSSLMATRRFRLIPGVQIQASGGTEPLQTHPLLPCSTLPSSIATHRRQ